MRLEANARGRSGGVLVKQLSSGESAETVDSKPSRI